MSTDDGWRHRLKLLGPDRERTNLGGDITR
jgi:hypothetical protein